MAGNPKYCTGCFKALYQGREGAEIDCTLLFADIRGSTQLAESMSSTEFRARMDRFYAAACAALVNNDAIVDKFAGDEVIGIFIPALTHGNHARDAIFAARELMRATGHDTDSPWAPTGIGINTGQAFVGVVGTADHIEFTALGDAVNVTSRLASLAGAGRSLFPRHRRHQEAWRVRMCGSAGASTSEGAQRRPTWWCSRWREAINECAALTAGRRSVQLRPMRPSWPRLPDRPARRGW